MMRPHYKTVDKFEDGALNLISESREAENTILLGYCRSLVDDSVAADLEDAVRMRLAEMSRHDRRRPSVILANNGARFTLDTISFGWFYSHLQEKYLFFIESGRKGRALEAGLEEQNHNIPKRRVSQ